MWFQRCRCRCKGKQNVKNVNQGYTITLINESDKPFKSFEAFCTHPLWQGLGLETDELLNYLRKAPGVKALVLGELEEMPEVGGAIGNKGGSDNKNKVDNINPVFKVTEEKPESKGGTSPSYLTKRLKRDNPELSNGMLNQYPYAYLDNWMFWMLKRLGGERLIMSYITM